MSETGNRLISEFQDEDYRYAYDQEFSNARMAVQIKVLREAQHWTQAELAELAGMKQSRISQLENVNYNAWSISTLRRLARALGVRLSFAFESWGELLSEVDGLSRDSITRPRFEDDTAFKPSKQEHASTDSAATRDANTLLTLVATASGESSFISRSLMESVPLIPGKYARGATAQSKPNPVDAAFASLTLTTGTSIATSLQTGEIGGSTHVKKRRA